MNKELFISVSLLLLTACGAPSEESKETTKRFDVNGTKIITDQQTGCKYLFYKNGYRGGLSPLYDDKGKLYCGKE